MDKKKITQEELRRTMSELKKKKRSTIKRIESPYAEYNELEQLICKLCKTIVRNEATWPVHVNSKAHKNNIELARTAKLRLSAAPQPNASNKRPSTFKEPHEPKKIKSILKNAPAPPPPPNGNSSLPADFFDNSSASKSNVVLPRLNITNGINGDTSLSNTEEKPAEDKDSKDNKGSKDNKDNGQAALPEGFFDDPVMDAKARNVEYKNPIEEEWERFQKEIKEQTAQSEQIIGDDQEEAATERQLDTIDEQLMNWKKVMNLVELKKLVQKVEKKQDSDDDSSDEEDIDEFLDWRAKKSYR